jgi:hypothetical protein
MNALARIDKSNVARGIFIFNSWRVCGLQWDEHTYPSHYSHRDQIFLDIFLGSPWHATRALFQPLCLAAVPRRPTPSP